MAGALQQCAREEAPTCERTVGVVHCSLLVWASLGDDGDGLETPYPMKADAEPKRASVKRLNLEAFIVDLLLLCTSMGQGRPAVLEVIYLSNA
jgi:hypothetical protein